MENKQIKELMKAMQDNQMDELELEREGVRLVLKRSQSGRMIQVPLQEIPPAQLYPHPVAPLPTQQPHAAAQPEASASPSKEEAFITSPMVGTFYRSPSPDTDPFVKEGDVVDENTVVCIIEAMKVMNEVKAGVKGVIQKGLIDDSHPVEFGTKLFSIEPN